ncbi:MAG: hypothetical protein PHO55_15130, partial [Thiomonas arsenitoxydans]|nr:hypothetical protein [Thiomonas arsenitoxydans]
GDVHAPHGPHSPTTRRREAGGRLDGMHLSLHRWGGALFLVLKPLLCSSDGLRRSAAVWAARCDN